MCIIHKGFKGFGALSPASIVGGNLIGLKSAIPYEIIHSTLAKIKERKPWKFRRAKAKSPLRKNGQSHSERVA